MLTCAVCGREYEVVEDEPALLKLKAARLPDPCCEKSVPGNRVAMWSAGGQ